MAHCYDAKELVKRIGQELARGGSGNDSPVDLRIQRLEGLLREAVTEISGMRIERCDVCDKAWLETAYCLSCPYCALRSQDGTPITALESGSGRKEGA